VEGLKCHRGKTAKIILCLNPYDICTGALTWRALMTTGKTWCFAYSANLSPYPRLGFLYK